MKKQLPRLGFGVGGFIKNDSSGLYPPLKAALDAGFIHIDCAQIYNNEFEIGQYIKKHDLKDKLYITSKVNINNYRNHTYTSTLESIRRLSVDNINLMLLHTSSGDENNVIAYKELMRCREEGFVDRIGVSNFVVKDLEVIFEETGEHPYINQIYISPTYFPNKIVDYCKNNNILVECYSVLRDYYFSDNSNYMSVEEKKYFESLAKKYNKGVSQIILRWAYQNDFIVLTQSRDPKRAAQNYQIFDFELSQDEMNHIKTFNRYNGQAMFYKVPANDIDYNKGLLFDQHFKK